MIMSTARQNTLALRKGASCGIPASRQRQIEAPRPQRWSSLAKRTPQNPSGVQALSKLAKLWKLALNLIFLPPLPPHPAPSGHLLKVGMVAQIQKEILRREKGKVSVELLVYIK